MSNHFILTPGLPVVADGQDGTIVSTGIVHNMNDDRTFSPVPTIKVQTADGIVTFRGSDTYKVDRAI